MCNASCDIKKDEEIFIDYIPGVVGESRKKALELWGIVEWNIKVKILVNKY